MRWPAEAIWEAIAPLLPGFTVEILPEIDSTNTELMRRARAGQAEPVARLDQFATLDLRVERRARAVCGDAGRGVLVASRPADQGQTPVQGEPVEQAQARQFRRMPMFSDGL